MMTAERLSDAEWHARRVRFNIGEIAELGARISSAPASDLWRCAARVAAAHRLGCFSDTVHVDFLRRLEVRRVQLGLRSAVVPCQ